MTPDPHTITCHAYTLEAAAPLGARAAGAIRHGALLRVNVPGVGAGYADLHCWPELGDAPLATQLELLRKGQLTSLTRACLAFADKDAQARAAGCSLWDGLSVPASHFLVPDFGARGVRSLDNALGEGFTHFKIKMGRDSDHDKRCLREMCAEFDTQNYAPATKPRIRLDLNETLTPAQFAEWFDGLQGLCPYLDFIEDPVTYDQKVWAELSAKFGVRFAVDRAAEEASTEAIVIVKPARTGTDVPRTSAGQRTVVTSYLGHPFGQLCAAWVAAQLPAGSRETHGLISHRVYVRTRFSDRLGWSGPYLQVPAGQGFGFDAELASLDWSPLP